MNYKVGEIARYAAVTIRTLHHYGEIGLLSPHGRSASGYRLYDDRDVDRLQQILFYRELGFSLDDIATILAEPGADPAEHLRRQRHLLVGRIERLEAMVAAIDRTTEARRMGYELTAEDRLEIFGDGGWTPPPSYAADNARRRGSKTGPFANVVFTPPDTKEGWQELEDRRRAFVVRLQAAMDAGLAAESAEAMDAVEYYRAVAGSHTHEQLRLIALWYARQPEYFGFIARPDEQRPGMPEYFREAVLANEARAAFRE